MAHVIPFRLPDPAKAPKREAPTDGGAQITYLGALKRQPPAPAGG